MNHSIPSYAIVTLLAVGGAAITGCGSSKKGSTAAAAASVSSAGTVGSPSGPQRPGPPWSPTPTPSPQGPPPANPYPTPNSVPSNGSGLPAGIHVIDVWVTWPQHPAVTLSYAVYVPTSYHPGVPMPLVVIAGIDLADYQALAEAAGFIVVEYTDMGMNGQYGVSYDMAAIWTLIADVESYWNVETKRRYYHGFDHGAEWGFGRLLGNSNMWAAGGISSTSGFLGYPNNVSRAVPFVMRHGSNDQVTSVQVARNTRDILQANGHTVALEEFAGGHTFDALEAQIMWAALQQHTRP